MNILLLLIPLSLLLLGAAAWAFSWAVRRGQFEDLDTPALDILREDVTERGPASRTDLRIGEDGSACNDADRGVPALASGADDAG